MFTMRSSRGSSHILVFTLSKKPLADFGTRTMYKGFTNAPLCRWKMTTHSYRLHTACAMGRNMQPKVHSSALIPIRCVGEVALLVVTKSGMDRSKRIWGAVEETAMDFGNHQSHNTKKTTTKTRRKARISAERRNEG